MGSISAKAVAIDYRAKVEGERTLELVDGRTTRHELAIARRIRYTAHDLDYAILVRSRIAMAEDGPSK